MGEPRVLTEEQRLKKNERNRLYRLRIKESKANSEINANKVAIAREKNRERVRKYRLRMKEQVKSDNKDIKLSSQELKKVRDRKYRLRKKIEKELAKDEQDMDITANGMLLAKHTLLWSEKKYLNITPETMQVPDSEDCSRQVSSYGDDLPDFVDRLRKSLCRVCGVNVGNMYPIFESVHQGEEPLSVKMNMYLPCKVEEEDAMPLVICSVCVDTLNRWHELNVTCISTNAALKRMFSGMLGIVP